MDHGITMDTSRFLSILPQFLILIPAAVSCYFAVYNQMRYTPFRTATLCLAVLLPYSFLGAWFATVLDFDVNIFLLPSLVLFFFLYRRTVLTDLPRCLAVYVGVCAVQTFPAQFAYAYDAFLHPVSGAADFSVKAAFFQLGLSCLIVAAFAYPAIHWFAPTVKRLNIPKIWYSTVFLSAIFLIFNMISVPFSYRTLHTGRLSYLFPLLECCALLLLVIIYVLFYQGAMLIQKHADLKEHSQLLEIQSHQYQTLKEHMRQTVRLRHDFRHSVRLLSSLAKKGDIKSIQKHLSGYETSLAENESPDFCDNAALNALFGYYYGIAVSRGINTVWHIQLPEHPDDAESDLASLFGNLIENAIDGCLTVPEEKRYFCLSIEVRQGNRLYIVSTNNFDGICHKDKDGYRSTKHRRKGIGLLSINAVAEKYNGTAHIANNDKEFFADIFLNLTAPD